MLNDVKKLEENLKLDYPNFFISFGKKITYSLQRIPVGSTNYAEGCAAIRFDLQDVNSEMSRTFKVKNGKSVKDLVGVLSCAHRTDELAVTMLHELLKTLGYKDELNEVGIPPGAPWTYRDLTFHGIDLPNGLITSAFEGEKAEVYEVVQQINFAFHITI